MAIRIRKINGHIVALCAASTKEKKGDVYLDDNAHHALTTKFAIDWDDTACGASQVATKKFADSIIAKLMLREESRGE